MLNALKYARFLQSAGVDREHAEAYIQVITEIVEVDMVTKQDFKDFESNVRQEFTDFKSSIVQEFSDFKGSIIQEFSDFKGSIIQEFSDFKNNIKQDFKELENNTKRDIKELEHKLVELEYRIVIKLGSLVGAIVTLAIGVSFALSKIFS